LNLPPEVVDPIVEKIIDDLRNRKGLRQAWDAMDADIQDEIKDEWGSFIMYLGS